MFPKQLSAFILITMLGFAAAEPIHRRAANAVFPTPPTTITSKAVIVVKKGQSFTPPKPFTRYDRGSGACSGQSEGTDADAVFLLEDGATLNKVTIGANQAEGVHCLGSCTLNDVYFEDVCEDAISLKGDSATTVANINRGGAKNASDKVIQHNSGGTVNINSFYVENFGKLYRSCGNCKKSFKRNVNIKDVTAVTGKLLAGINSNFGDVATITTTKTKAVKDICERFQGTTPGNEPKSLGKGADAKSCLFKAADITAA